MERVRLSGRSNELNRLAAPVDDINERGAALLVKGEPGIGKSCLMRAAVERARGQGHLVLEATGVESEEQLPFAGLQQLLEPVLAAASQALPRVQLKALETALGLAEGSPPQPFLVGLAALNLIGDVAASTRPTVVAVDDAQWLDWPTQEVLAFLARRITGDPVVMVLAIRTGYQSPLLLANLPELTLSGLDETASRELLAASAEDLTSADCERILQLALGNPLALVELPAAWRSAGAAVAQLVPHLVPLSGRLERAFAARLAELPSLTRDCLLVGAVDADDDLPEVLAATAVLAGRHVDAAIVEPAVRAGLLTFDNAHLRFRHPLVKSGVLQAESTSRRQAANAALAQVLLHHPLRRAWYRAQATIGPDDEVADELATTHAESLRRGSVTAAITALERSAQLTRDSSRRGHRLLMAAELAYGLGRADMVARLLKDAGRNALTGLDRARMEWLRELPDETDFTADRRVIQLTDIAAHAMARSDVDLALNLLVAAAVRCFWGQPHPDVRDRVVEMTESLTSAAADPRHLAAVAVAHPLLQARRVGSALSLIEYENVVDPEALALWGMAAHAIGDQPRAADFLDRAEDRCRLEGRMGLLTRVLSLHSAVSIDLGDWRGATAAADESRRLGEETGQAVWGSGSLTVVARLHALMGEPQALTQATELEVSLRQRKNTCFLAAAVLSRALALLSAGRNAEAYDALRRLFDPEDPSCHERERLAGVMYLAEAAVHSGRIADARILVEQLEQTALITPSPILHTHLLYARAVLAKDRDAEHLYLSALEQDLVRWPLTEARLELAYGSWLRRHRRATEARVPLRSALATFEAIGGKRWSDRARSELRAAGERNPARHSSHSGHAWQDVLTAQELQIARLAAEGLTNRDIAERLFLSHRTVSAHLYRIFPKLNITSRNQLAALFATRS